MLVKFTAIFKSEKYARLIKDCLYLDNRVTISSVHMTSIFTKGELEPCIHIEITVPEESLYTILKHYFLSVPVQFVIKHDIDERIIFQVTNKLCDKVYSNENYKITSDLLEGRASASYSDVQDTIYNLLVNAPSTLRDAYKSAPLEVVAYNFAMLSDNSSVRMNKDFEIIQE